MKLDGSQVSNIPSYNELLPAIKNLLDNKRLFGTYGFEDLLSESYIVYVNCIKRNKRKRLNNFKSYYLKMLNHIVKRKQNINIKWNEIQLLGEKINER